MADAISIIRGNDRLMGSDGSGICFGRSMMRQETC